MHTKAQIEYTNKKGIYQNIYCYPKPVAYLHNITNEIYPLNNQMLQRYKTCGPLTTHCLIFIFVKCYNAMNRLWWLEEGFFKQPTQQLSTNIHPKNRHQEILSLTRWGGTFLAFILYMYRFNPNTTRSPIWDYLIMFTLAKMIYQNVTRKVTSNKNLFLLTRKIV